MLIFETDDLGDSYPRLINQVLDEGEEVSPRGERVYEVRPLILHLTQPELCIVKRPGFSRALMWLEILTIIAGEFDRRLFTLIAPNASERMNEYGAYGPRIIEQLREVEKELKRDKDSRRAMVYVGRPDDLRVAYELDMPCTATIQVLLRNGLLEMIVNMRSWDLVWGLSYDVPCFVAIQQMLAAALRVPVGTYTHIAGSAHIYDRHRYIEPERGTSVLLNPFAFFGTPVETQQRQAKYILNALRGANTTQLALKFMTATYEDMIGSIWKKVVANDNSPR